MVARALRDIQSGEIIFVGNDPDGHLENYVSPDGFKVISLGSSRAPLSALDYASRLESVLSEVCPDRIVLDISPVPWLLYVKLPPVPQAFITNYFVSSLGRETTLQDRNFDVNGPAINAGRKQAGLPELNNIRELYEKELVILADPGDVLPDTEAMPPHYRLAGAIWWEPESSLPEELADLDDILYVSIGSTGSRVPDMIVEKILTSLDIKYVVAASVRDTNISTPDAIPVKHYASLPGSQVLARSAFVITQGGAGSCYQALSAGVPMGFWPNHLNHYLLGSRLSELGAGILLDEDTIDEKIELFKKNKESFSKNLNEFHPLDPDTAARSAAVEISKLP